MTDTLAARIGANILARREALGLNQRQFALRLGTSQSLVARWESGRNCPGAQNLYDAADVLGVTVGWLFGEDGGTGAVEVAETAVET